MHILIIDDHPLYREVLSDHIKEFIPQSIIFESASIEESIGLMQYKQFDFICLDLVLPGMDGLQGFLEIRKEVPEALIVVISGSGDSSLAQEIIDCGANGYISKASGVREMQNALTLILNGEIYISPSIFASSSVQKAIDTHKQQSSQIAGLTPRQQEVFSLMAKGLPNKSIANQLHCSEGTIKLHVSAILRAMNVRNRTEAVQSAGALNLVSSP